MPSPAAVSFSVKHLMENHNETRTNPVSHIPQRYLRYHHQDSHRGSNGGHRPLLANPAPTLRFHARGSTHANPQHRQGVTQ